MVHIYTTGKTINIFAIGYMINHPLKFNKIFKTQVENAWVILFYSENVNYQGFSYEEEYTCYVTNNDL